MRTNVTGCTIPKTSPSAFGWRRWRTSRESMTCASTPNTGRAAALISTWSRTNLRFRIWWVCTTITKPPQAHCVLKKLEIAWAISTTGPYHPVSAATDNLVSLNTAGRRFLQCSSLVFWYLLKKHSHIYHVHL